MPQYIDKDALVAEIERRKEINKYRDTNDGLFEDEAILYFIDTPEVKEVDLEKEFSQWWKSERAKDYNVDILYERYSNASMKLARHFYSLGLAQKGGNNG